MENSDVRGQISRKLHVGFPPNVVCKTSKILSNNFQWCFQLVTLYIWTELHLSDKKYHKNRIFSCFFNFEPPYLIRMLTNYYEI